MKKILAVSLVAIMAVSTARADIASTAYVQGAVGAEKALRESADNTIKNSIGEVKAENMGTQASTVVTAIKEHSDAIDDMDLNEIGGNGKYIKTIKQEDGKVTATEEEADTTPTQNSMKMVTSGGVYTALAGKQGNLSTTQMAAVNSGVTAAKVATYDAYDNRIKTAQDTADAKEPGVNKVSAIKEGMTTAEKQVAFPTVSLVEELIDDSALETGVEIGALNEAIAGINNSDVMKSGVTSDTVTQVATNTAAIATLNGAGAGSVSKTVGDALKSYSTTEQMNEAIANNAVNTVVAGDKNGTIKVDDTEVSVTGLKSAAYTESSDYATAAQGTAANAAKSVTDAITGADTLAEGQGDGNYVLTMKKEGSNITYKWEAIDRAYEAQQ